MLCRCWPLLLRAQVQQLLREEVRAGRLELGVREEAGPGSAVLEQPRQLGVTEVRVQDWMLPGTVVAAGNGNGGENSSVSAANNGREGGGQGGGSSSRQGAISEGVGVGVEDLLLLGMLSPSKSIVDVLVPDQSSSGEICSSSSGSSGSNSGDVWLLGSGRGSGDSGGAGSSVSQGGSGVSVGQGGSNDVLVERIRAKFMDLYPLLLAIPFAGGLGGMAGWGGESSENADSRKEETCGP